MELPRKGPPWKGQPRIVAPKTALYPAAALGVETDHESLELPGINGVAHLLHDLQVVVQVVDGIQARTQNFTGSMQMMQVGAREIAAGVAGTCRIERLIVVFITRIL